jgi:hypothetical protein
MITTISSSLQQLLRQKDQVLSRTLGQGLSTKEIASLFTLCLGLLMSYGVLIGARYGALQLVSSAIKMPILFLLTTAICFPTLYMFLSYLGIKQGLKQLVGLMLLSLTYISLVLAAFAPVTFFFLITTDGYEFYKFVNVIIFGIAGFIGIRLFYSQMAIIINEAWKQPQQVITDEDALQTEPANCADNTKKARNFLFAWAIMFAFIGAQLSYTLSPFFGDPNLDFVLINAGNSNFFMDVLYTLSRLF